MRCRSTISGGRGGKPLSDPAYQSAVLQFRGIGLRPLSPVHPAARWSGGGLALAWTRRTRIGGDSWDQAEVPLAEEGEAYDVEILDGAGDVVRTLTASSPSLLYAAAQIAADFPLGLPSPFRFRIYQRSAIFGRGAAATAEVWFVS